jgi:NAD+ synthase
MNTEFMEKVANLDYETIYNAIKDNWTTWAERTGAKKFVLGISGGKDSSVCAALAVKIFGKENVFGVLMPNGIQSDIKDAYTLCELLGIEYTVIHIDDAYDTIMEQIWTIPTTPYPNSTAPNFPTTVSDQTRINLPPRLRMATLFAVAQTYGGRVIRTCNMSEDYVGYSTLFGDDCGAYQPLETLTAIETMYLGKWLGLPDELTFKTPSDGLCGKTDEDNLGFTYADLDATLRWFEIDREVHKKIYEKWEKNTFKGDMVRVPGPYISTMILKMYGHDTEVSL